MRFRSSMPLCAFVGAALPAHARMDPAHRRSQTGGWSVRPRSTSERQIAQATRTRRRVPYRRLADKLAVAATALDAWPADKMLRSRVFGSGPLKGARIDGELILQGAGDPR